MERCFFGDEPQSLQREGDHALGLSLEGWGYPSLFPTIHLHCPSDPPTSLWRTSKASRKCSIKLVAEYKFCKNGKEELGEESRQWGQLSYQLQP